jgi:hypothetical protein
MVSELLLKWKLNWICSNLNRIVVLFNPCNMVLNSSLKFFSKRTVKSCLKTRIAWKIWNVFHNWWFKKSMCFLANTSFTKGWLIVFNCFFTNMKVVFFTFVFECYQESVMFHFCPFWAKKVIGFLTVLFTKKFKKHRCFELSCRSCSCRFWAEWDVGEFFYFRFWVVSL